VLNIFFHFNHESANEPLSKLGDAIFENEIFVVLESTEDAYSSKICWGADEAHRKFWLKDGNRQFQKRSINV